MCFNNSTANTCTEARLDSLIHSWNLQRCPVAKDGNCCFVSTVKGLQRAANLSTTVGLTHLEGFDISSVDLLSKQLQLAVVHEWKENEAYYRSFLSGSVDEEADKFKQDGFFASDLGDSVLNALSNVVGMQFIVFTGQVSYPVIHIMPREILHEELIYLAFNNEESGHYDAVAERQYIQQSNAAHQQTQRTTNCTCGKNSKSAASGRPCVPITRLLFVVGV